MPNDKYSELDAAIIKRIQSGFTRFYEIWPAIPSHLTNSNPHTSSDSSRIIDRRLQALRKRKKIACFGQTWRVLWLEEQGQAEGQGRGDGLRRVRASGLV